MSSAADSAAGRSLFARKGGWEERLDFSLRSVTSVFTSDGNCRISDRCTEGKSLLKKLALYFFLIVFAVASSANARTLHVSIDTTPLQSSAGRIALDLVDGDKARNNSVSVSNVETDGTFGGIITYSAGSSGALPAGIDLDDMGFLNSVVQEFTFGTSLRFDVTVTEHYQVPEALQARIPDGFSIQILSAVVDTELPANALLVVDLVGPPTGIVVHRSGLLAPNVPDVRVEVVPEAAIEWAAAAALASLSLLKASRRKQRRIRRDSWLSAAALIALAASVAASTDVSAEAVDISRGVRVDFSGLVYDRAANTFETLVSVRNTSSAAIQSPASLVAIGPTGLEWLNPTGDLAGAPLIEIAVSPEGLPAGANASPLSLAFRRSDPGRISFGYIVTGQLPPPDGTLFTNPSDPAIVSQEMTDGTAVTYSGTKEADGTLASVDDALVNPLSSDPSDRSKVHLNALGQPVLVETGDGSRVVLDWSASGTLNLTITDTNGITETVQVDVPADNLASSMASTAAGVTAFAASSQASNSATGSVTTACYDQPIPALVYGSYFGETPGERHPLSFSNAAPGQYQYLIPITPYFHASEQLYCNEVLGTLGDYVCPVLSNPLTESVTFGNACVRVRNPILKSVCVVATGAATAVRAACASTPKGFGLGDYCSALKFVDAIAAGVYHIDVDASLIDGGAGLRTKHQHVDFNPAVLTSPPSVTFEFADVSTEACLDPAFCGNGRIDIDKGEECDETASNSPERCWPPHSPHECTIAPECPESIEGTWSLFGVGFGGDYADYESTPISCASPRTGQNCQYYGCYRFTQAGFFSFSGGEVVGCQVLGVLYGGACGTRAGNSEVILKCPGANTSITYSYSSSACSLTIRYHHDTVWTEGWRVRWNPSIRAYEMFVPSPEWGVEYFRYRAPTSGGAN